MVRLRHIRECTSETSRRKMRSYALQPTRSVSLFLSSMDYLFQIGANRNGNSLSIVIARNDCRDKTSPSPFIVMFGCQLNFLRRKSRKNAHFLPRITTFASDNSERSLAIQNDVLQSSSLISKSLPIRISPNGNLLLLS